MADAIVYGLVDPRNEELRYVGKSVSNADGRFRSHVRKAYNGTEDFKSSWIRSLIDQGLKPVLVVLDEVPAERVLEVEAAWITAAWEVGFPLTNLVGVRRGRH